MIGQRTDWVVTDESIFATPKPDHLPQFDPLTLGMLTMKDAVRLFKRFNDNLSSWCFSLDPVLQTPTALLSCSTFLFTVVCAVSSLFCPLSRHIAPPLKTLVVDITNHILINGNRSVSIVQGLCLAANYLCNPAMDDPGWFCSWLFMRS